MTPFEWITIASSVLASSGGVLLYLLRRIEKIEIRVTTQDILYGRLDERLKAMDEKLDMLLMRENPHRD